jgi:hypothetical protein
MTNEQLAGFIWFGERLVNINHVAQFTITNDGTRVCALLAGVVAEDAEVIIEGGDASILIRELKRASRLEAPVRPFAQFLDGKKKDT